VKWALAGRRIIAAIATPDAVCEAMEILLTGDLIASKRRGDSANQLRPARRAGDGEG
jgi:hypothetical protein